MRVRAIQVAAMSAIVVLICAAYVLAQSDVKPEDPAGSAKIYLEALKTSDFVKAGEGATPSAVRWSTQYLPVVFDYKILRGQAVCSDQFLYDDVREDVLRYVQAVERFDAITDPAKMRTGSPPDLAEMTMLQNESAQARGQIVNHSKCLGAVLNESGALDLIPKWTTPSGTVTASLHNFIIDVDEPGKGGARVTTRRQLFWARIGARDFSSGWRVLGFGPLRPNQ